MKSDNPTLRQTSYTLENAFWDTLARLLAHLGFIAACCISLILISMATTEGKELNYWFWGILAFVFTAVNIGILLKTAETFLRELNQADPKTNFIKIILHRLVGIPAPPLLSAMHPEKYFDIVKINNGALEEPNNNWVTWLGGPALLGIDANSAVYIERGIQFSRVEGSGYVFLHRDETIKHIINLEPETRSGDIAAWTKDGIRVEIDAEFVYQIGSLKKQEETDERRFPFEPPTIKRAAEAGAVFFNEKENRFIKGDVGKVAWNKILIKLANHIRSCNVDELLSESSDTTALDQYIEDWVTELNDNLQHSGVIIQNLVIKDVKAADPIVTETIQESWAAKEECKTIIKEGKVEAAELRERETRKLEGVRKRERALRTVLESMSPEHFHQYVSMRLREAEGDVESPTIRSQLINQLLVDLKKSIKDWEHPGAEG